MIDLIRRGQTNVYGQISDVVLKGNTWTNKAGAGDTSPQTVSNLDATKTYLLINDAGANITIDTVDTPTPVKLTGATEFGFEWASGKIALYELSMAEAALDAAVLGQKYHYVSGTKSTNSVRLVSVGKNIIPLKDLMWGGTSKVNVDGDEFYFTTASGDNVKISDIISLKPSETYTIKATLMSVNGYLDLFDENNNIIQGNIPLIYPNGYTFTGRSKVRIRFGSSSVGVEVRYKNLILNVGSSILPYEPYKESIVNVNLPEPLRSLPNGVKDEVNVSTGIKTQRNNGVIIIESDIKAINTAASEDLEVVSLKKPIDFVYYNSTAGKTDGYVLEGFIPVALGIAVGNIFNHWNAMSFGVCVPKGTTLAQAKEQLAGLSLTYQLAEPVVTQLDPIPLTIFPNGTQYIEFGNEETAIYADGIAISNTETPILELKKVDKLHIENGHWKRTAIDLANVTVVGDGLSLTIANAANGEIYEVEWDYDSALSTNPDLEVGEPSLVTRNNRTIVL